MAVWVLVSLLPPVALAESPTVFPPLVVGQLGSLLGEAQKALPVTGTPVSSSDLDGWDAFLVFVLKGLGADVVDPAVRDDLFDLLLIDRYDQLAFQAGDAPKTSGDPLLNLFSGTWGRLTTIIESAGKRGLLGEKVGVYTEFLKAGNPLFSVGQFVPGVSGGISNDALRNLALMLRPGYTGDPLLHTFDLDPSLRSLFGFSSTLIQGREDGLPTFVDGWWFPLAHAEEEVSNDPEALTKRLDRWVPQVTEFDAYKPVLRQLLQITTDRVLQSATLDERYTAIYRTMMPTTALQESCWRQFTQAQGKVIPHASALGSVGLMQINQRVWRGFYDLEQLRWNASYNALAGAEILLRYMQRYGIKDGEQTGTLENAARSTYSVYNAGPRAISRYRNEKSSSRERKVDDRFWGIYQGFAAGGEANLSTCAVN